MEKTAEKRKDVRHRCFVPMDGENSIFGRSETVDLSKNGIGFISSAALSVKQKIAIELELTPEGESVLVVGRIRWVRAVNGSQKFRYGLQFVKMPTGTRSRLTQYLHK